MFIVNWVSFFYVCRKMANAFFVIFALEDAFAKSRSVALLCFIEMFVRV